MTQPRPALVVPPMPAFPREAGGSQSETHRIPACPKPQIRRSSRRSRAGKFPPGASPYRSASAAPPAPASLSRPRLPHAGEIPLQPVPQAATAQVSDSLAFRLFCVSVVQGGQITQGLDLIFGASGERILTGNFFHANDGLGKVQRLKPQ